MTEKKFEKANMDDGEAAKIQAQWRGVNERIEQDAQAGKPFEKANLGGKEKRATGFYGLGQGQEGDAEAQARQVLLAGQMKRVQAAQKEAEAVHAKYRVALDVYMIVRPNGTIVQAQFVPQEGWAGDPSDV